MVHPQPRNEYVTRRIAKSLRNIDLKLLLIPIVLVLLKIWGIIRYFIGVSPGCQRPRLNPDNPTLMCGFCITNNSICGAFYNDFLLGMHVSAYLFVL